MKAFSRLRRIGVALGFIWMQTGHSSHAGVEAWTNRGPVGRVVLAVAVDPKAPATLYAGTDEGVFKSTNSGASWGAASTGLPPGSFFGDPRAVVPVAFIGVNPVQPTTLYAVTQTIMSELAEQRIFVSVNGGGNWSDTGFRRSKIDTLVIDPKNPAVLYTGADSVVYKSVDGGGRWSNVFQVSLPNPPPSPATIALAVDPVTPTTVYAGYHYQSGFGIGHTGFTGVLMKSTNGGVNWTTISPDPVQAIVIDPVTPSTLYVARYPTGFIHDDPAAGGGVAKSTDGGASWALLNFPALLANVLMIDPTTPTTLYAAINFQNQRVSRSTDGGQSWYFINYGLPDFLTLSSLAVAPSTGATLYAGVSYIGQTSAGGVFDIDVAGLVATEMLANFESPEAGQAVSGIGVIRGWTFVPQQRADIKNVYVSVSDKDNSVSFASFFVPCCSERGDVRANYPQFPASHTLNSGWGAPFNWGVLPAGDHELRVQLENTAGERVFLPPHLVTVVKPGDFEFLDQFGLSAARASITGDQVTLSGVVVREKRTQQQKQINARFQWFTNTQSLGLVGSETISTFSSQQSVMSRLLAAVSVGLPAHLGSVATVEAAGGITGYIESPADNQAASGISILRGWAFAEEVGVPIHSVELTLDGEAIGTVSCCSPRADVRSAFFDNPNASFSGWGMQYNLGVLPPGAHTLTAKMTAGNGITQTFSRSFFSARIGGFSFIDQFDVAGATVRIEGAEVVLGGVRVRDKDSQQTKVIEVRLRWFEHAQALGIVAAN
ncbi:MAG: exo-alpha-sialidase [Deltaproteobacteria bacterium]|nr:exo-alpha-sialidase [Deltaproteobacteria bacterium]